VRFKLLDKLVELRIASQVYPEHRIVVEDKEDEPVPERYNPRGIFETDRLDGNLCCLPHDLNFSHLTYFLDGSRRTSVIATMTYGEKLLPIVAGQVGAACCSRISRIVKKVKLDTGYYLVFPDVLENYDSKKIEKEILPHMPVPVKLEKYNVAKSLEDKDKPPVELAIAKLTSLMHRKELKLIKWLDDNGCLSHRQLLVVDGSLQFSDTHGTNFDNVIGVSKTFRIHDSGKARQRDRQIGVVLARLPFGSRTPVFKVGDEARTAGAERGIGYWFLRIRPTHPVFRSPLHGVVKVEMITQGTDHCLDSSMVNNISKFLILDRNPTCYGIEARWHNMLYPIYLTEQLLKKSFLSELHFVSLF
jgi:hypothetical protein